MKANASGPASRGPLDSVGLVAQHLKAWLAYSGRDAQYYYWRTRRRRRWRWHRGRLLSPLRLRVPISLAKASVDNLELWADRVLERPFFW